MTRYRLKIAREDFEELRRLVLMDLPVEAAAFGLAGVAKYADCVDVLVRRPVSIPKRLMVVQNEYHLEIAPEAINGMAALCEVNQLGAVICHSHSEGLRYSPSDDYGESRIVGTLREFIRDQAPTASLLFTPNNVTGRLWLAGEPHPINFDEIVIVGHYLQKIALRVARTEQEALDLYDRQVRAFGEDGQRTIFHAKVGIAGLGGTGSAVAEQLTRLGVSDFVLVDPDTFSNTNLTRVFGTYNRSVKRPKLFPQYKAALVASNLRRIRPNIRIKAIRQNVVLTGAASALLDRDILFLCTDEHWGRSICNQIAYQYLIPAINMGVRVTSDDGAISHAVGMVDVLRAGKACLWCKQFLRAERIYEESLPPEQRRSLAQEGYVEDLDSKTPSVVSFTTSIASSAVSLFIHFMTNYMGDAGNISRISFDFLTGLSRRGTTNLDAHCICQKVKGFGDLTALPTLVRLPG